MLEGVEVDLASAYLGPYEVVSRPYKTFTPRVGAHEEVVDWLKPTTGDVPVNPQSIKRPASRDPG